MTNIERYTEKHTPSDPFKAKVVQAYLESLLLSDSIASAFYILRQNMMFDFLPNSLWKTASQYNDPILRAIIAYSMLKKDKKLFEMVMYYYNKEGFVRMFISRELFSSFVEYTDEQQLIDGTMQDATTDTNLYTDMTSGHIYEVFIDVYKEDNDPLGLGGPTFDELLGIEKNMSGFLTIVKPARVNLLMTRSPYVGFKPGESPDYCRHSLCVDLIQNTLYTPEALSLLATKTFGEIASGLPYELHLNEASLSIPIDPVFEMDGSLFKATYYVQRDSSVIEDLQEIWHTLEFDTDFGVLYFNINNIREQEYTDIYFAKVVFWLPCRGI